MELTLTNIIVRLVLAATLSGLIGIERELRDKPAGVRTNALIGLGSCLMTLCGIYIASFMPGTSDPGRIASIVVQGIGFIGAGSIIQSSGSISGLTTAATMWVVAGIGIACGMGFYWPAAIATLIVFILLSIFGRVEMKLLEKKQK